MVSSQQRSRNEISSFNKFLCHFFFSRWNICCFEKNAMFFLLSLWNNSEKTKQKFLIPSQVFTNHFSLVCFSKSSHYDLDHDFHPWCVWREGGADRLENRRLPASSLRDDSMKRRNTRWCGSEEMQGGGIDPRQVGGATGGDPGLEVSWKQMETVDRGMSLRGKHTNELWGEEDWRRFPETNNRTSFMWQYSKHFV